MQMREEGKKRRRFRTCTTKLENTIKFCEINEINWQDNYTLGESTRLAFVILKSLIGNNLSDTLLVTFFLFGAE